MKTYEDYSSSPDGWNVSCTLELTDDGRFSYSEGRTDYTNASLSGGAGGTWRRGVGAIFFRAERVYPPMYFPWVAGQELIATVRGDALEFAHGWTLRPPTPPSEYIIETPVSNDGAEPLTLVLEPWGIRHTLAPGESVQVVAKGSWGWSKPVVERVADEIVFNGRDASWATVVPEPPPPPPKPKPKPPAPPPKPSVGAAKPAAERPVQPPVKPPAPSPPKAPFEPRAPSPELAALLRRWIDELPTGGLGNYVGRLCKENDAILLDGNQIYLWVLRTDGQVLCIDHESFAQRAEPEENAAVAYDMIEVGTRTHPELSELLPPDRRGPRQGD
jgi:hypothetical protein